MRRIKYRFIIMSLMVLISLTVGAQRKYINYFSVGGDVCLPVKVKLQSGELTIINNNERHDGNIVVREAFDCQGRRIVDTSRKSYDYQTNPDISINYYSFTLLYSQNESEGYNENLEDSNSRSSQNASKIVDALFGANKRSRNISSRFYPNATLHAGLSRVHGEYIRAKACLGGVSGFIMYGGVGCDFLFDAKNEKYKEPNAQKICWHAGLGMYFGLEKGEIDILLDYADTPLVQNGSINLMVEGSWFCLFGGHFGPFGGIGYSMGDFKAKKPVFNFIFEAGIACRIF